MKPVPHVRVQLERAKLACERLHAAPDVGEAHEAWKNFLYQLDRVWNKGEAHFSNSGKWSGWNGRFSRLRKQDPLLRYLFQARNCDEHTIDEIAVQREGFTAINAATPGGMLTINSLEFRNGQMSVDLGSDAVILHSPARLELLDVKSRGVNYAVPSQHLGKPIASRDPGEFARLGLRFYESFVEEAERYFYD